MFSFFNSKRSSSARGGPLRVHDVSAQVQNEFSRAGMSFENLLPEIHSALLIEAMINGAAKTFAEFVSNVKRVQLVGGTNEQKTDKLRTLYLARGEQFKRMKKQVINGAV